MSILFWVLIVLDFFTAAYAAGNIRFLESRTHLEGTRLLMQEARQRRNTMLGTLRRHYHLSFGSQGEVNFLGRKLSTGGKPFNWLMDKNGKIYGVFDDIANHVFQSSLLGKDWPLAVGTLQTDEHGFISLINNRSMLFSVNRPSFDHALKMLAG